MNATELKPAEHEPAHGESAQRVDITVSINGQRVVFHERKATGAEIKATAIAAGLQIQADFVVFEVKGDDDLVQVGDDEPVTLHEHQKFRIVAPDDTSNS